MHMTLWSRAIRVLGLGALLVSMVLGAQPTMAQQPPQLPQSVAELTRVREDVYAFRYLNHVALFVPTDEGVVLVDPIGGGGNPKAPIALKAAIASITDQPVKYLVYSHSAADHNTGGAIFADTATIVGHANSKARIEQRNDPTSPPPSVTFEQSMPIDLGGKHFELTWDNLGPEDDYLVFNYPAQKVVMAVDMARVRTLPFGNLGNASPEKVMELLDRLDQLEFETYLSGHGPVANIMGTRQDLRDYRQYFLDLQAAVKDAQQAGHADNSEQMVAAVRDALMPKYGTWASFPNGIAGNVEGVLRWSKM
jgi:glyoxylase-like metal-dependent hydrolase (beta-lactamase superfamily II)